MASQTGLRLIEMYEHGFVLYDSEACKLEIADRTHLVIGTIYPAVSAPELGSDATASAQLLSRSWGQFVAVASSSNGAELSILRDPPGFMPCYYVEGANSVAAASDVDLLVEASLVRPEVDREALVRHLHGDTLRTSQTCLKNVKELHPGSLLVVAQDEIRLEQVWSPFDYTKAALEIRDPHDAALGLRRVIDATVSTLSSPFAKVLLAVSGGLDSSVVACALANAGKPFECVTLATEEAAGDERAFARPLAQAVGAVLYERFEDLRLIDIAHSDSIHLPRPVSRSFGQSADKTQARLAREIGADGFFHGGGGDNVFCYMTSSRVIADRLIRDGWRAAWGTSLDMIDLTGGGLWDAWRGALRRRYLQSSRFDWPWSGLFLHPDVEVSNSHQDEHPWLRPAVDCLPGKALHVAWLAGITNRLEGYGRAQGGAVVAPLLAQPVIEYCLRIPTWLWCSGGLNRSMAREAYRDMLPPAVFSRTTKGTPSALSFRLIEENRALIRRRLSEGRLADFGIIDVPRVQTALQEKYQLSIEECVRICLLNDVESWIRGWEAKAASAHH